MIVRFEAEWCDQNVAIRFGKQSFGGGDTINCYELNEGQAEA